MTTTTVEAPEEGEENVDESERGFIKLKTIHDINIFVDPGAGNFYAKFSQGSGVKWFSRGTLLALEQLITRSIYPFSGHVEIAVRPANIIGERELTGLRAALGEAQSTYAYQRINRQRPTIVLTGVHRRSYNKWTRDSEVMFRNSDGHSESFDSMSYVVPNASLDAEIYALAELYLQNQVEWHEKFKAIIDRYETMTPDDIVQELKKQGARAGRG